MANDNPTDLATLYMCEAFLRPLCKCDHCRTDFMPEWPGSQLDDHRLSLHKMPGVDLDDLAMRAQSWEVSAKCWDYDTESYFYTWGTVEKMS